METLLTRGVDKIYPSREELQKVLESGKKLTLYCGYDPTAPQLHIGHVVTMLKLADFQKMGHKVIFLIGDFTGMIGDPTDKSATRVKLTREQVLENAKTYKHQASKILDFENTENPVEVKFNSEWNDKLTFRDVIELSSSFTLQQMIERDMFQKRLSENKPVSLHEFFYPMMQGYDSVAMNVDLEVGGSDQTFNMLAGRTLMKQLKSKEKFVVTTKLLEDENGKKMSKSEGNFIALDDTPKEMYIKVMVFPDTLIVPGLELCTRIPQKVIEEVQVGLNKGENPINHKKFFAYELVKFLYSEEDAKEAQDNFERVIQNKEKPLEIPYQELTLSSFISGPTISNIAMGTQMVDSKSEFRRLVEQDAVYLDGQKIEDPNLLVRPNEKHELQIGKKNIKEFKINE